MLELANISYHIGEKTLLRDISLKVQPGEVIAIVGANGAGKTTMMKILCGALKPESGIASLDGKEVSSFHPDHLARRRAVLPQYSTLTFAFSSLEVVMMGRTPHKTTASEDLDIALQAMEAAGVAHLASQNYTTLSGGEQQRVHLARVLAQIWHPCEDGDRYLFLDEPTASLDLSHQHQVLRIARQAAQGGVGVLTVLHDLNLASQHADRIIVMRQGRLTAEGTPDEVMTPDIINDAFDIHVMVTRHPAVACPLIVALPEDTQDLSATEHEPFQISHASQARAPITVKIPVSPEEEAVIKEITGS